MAVRVWLGTFAGQIGNWDEGHNWLDENGADAGVVPVASDDVYFTSGSQDVQADTVDSSAITLTSLNFGVKWTGSFVEVVNPTSGVTTTDTLAVAEVNATTLDYANKLGSVGLEGTFTTINVQATSIDSPALKFQASTITNLHVTGGNGTVFVDENSTVSGSINMIGASSVKVEIESNATVSAADLTIDKGTFLTYMGCDTITQYGGTVAILTSTQTTNAITMYKGTCKYKPTDDATLTALVIYGGYFDMRGCNAPTHTITDATIYSGSMIDERNGLANTTYTNPILVNGGVIKCDLGRQVTVT